MNQDIKSQKYLSEIISSPETLSAIKNIENILGLNIDQTGELYVLISEIITGKEKSANFIEQVKIRLGANTSLANKIAELTNKEIFDVIKNKLQSDTSTPTDDHSSITTLERVGNFSIEHEAKGDGSGEVGQGTHWKEVTAADRSKILAGVEDPPEAHRSDILETKDSEAFHEPIVDYVMDNPIGQKERTDVVQPADNTIKHAVAEAPANLPVVEEVTVAEKAQVVPTKPVVEVKKEVTPPRSGPDPYHESIT